VSTDKLFLHDAVMHLFGAVGSAVSCLSAKGLYYCLGGRTTDMESFFYYIFTNN